MSIQDNALEMERKNSLQLRRKKKAVRLIGLIARYIFLLLIGYVVLFQLFYMISYAFRPDEQLYDPAVVWLPRTWTLENYGTAFMALDYAGSLMTTVSYLMVSAVIEIVSCALVAYGLARFKFPEQKLIFALVLLTILVPPQMLSVASYVQFSHLDILGIVQSINKIFGTSWRINVIDTVWPFWLPSLFGVGIRSGLFIFIYRQFFSSLPRELEEAAWIDGAGSVRTFTSIIVPSSGSAVLTVSIFSILWHWNDYYQSSMYIETGKTLNLALDRMTTALKELDQKNTPNIQMAACFLVILPVLLLYMIAQRWFIRSIERSGIVG